MWFVSLRMRSMQIPACLGQISANVLRRRLYLQYGATPNTDKTKLPLALVELASAMHHSSIVEPATQLSLVVHGEELGG